MKTNCKKGTSDVDFEPHKEMGPIVLWRLPVWWSLLWRLAIPIAGGAAWAAFEATL